LIPAWGVYKIAPEDKFLANGDFSGFKINATGSAALYIVLFAAIYVQVNPIIVGIDSTRALKTQLSAFLNNKPWMVKYNLTLMDNTGAREIQQNEYERYIQADSITCIPRPLVCGTDYKTIQFYIDNNDLDRKGYSLKSMLTVNGYGTSSFLVTKKNAQFDTTNHVITFSPTIYRAHPNLQQINDLNMHKIAALSPSDDNKWTTQ
jgi:hypothetical protein